MQSTELGIIKGNKSETRVVRKWIRESQQHIEIPDDKYE